MNNDKRDMMDLAIVDELKELLENDPNTHAMWIAGSIAEGFADGLSDVDLWVDVSDGKDQELYSAIESFLETKGELDVKLGRSLEQPYTHRVYHIKDTNPYHFVEFTLHTHSHKHDFSQGNRKIKILFDKDGTIPTDIPEEVIDPKERQARKQSLIDKIEVGYASVEKEIIRGQFMDAMHNYEFWLVTPIIEIVRIKHAPLKTSYGLKHGSHHLPKEAQDEIQSLYTIKSLDDFRNKIDEVKKMVAKYA